jgi:hypothetical protein
MQQWAEGAKEHPASWAQSQGDDLLFRRIKMRLKSNYEHTQRNNGKKRGASLQKNFVDTCNRHHGTANILPNIAETADLLQWSSLDRFIDGRSNMDNSDPYRRVEATFGDKGTDGVEDELVTTQELPVPAITNLFQEAPNIASDSGLYLEYPPHTLLQNNYEPPQPTSMFQEYWDTGEDAKQLSQPQTEVFSQDSNVHNTEVDFNDPFWTTVFASSGDSAFNSHTNLIEPKTVRAVQYERNCSKALLGNRGSLYVTSWSTTNEVEKQRPLTEMIRQPIAQ